MSDDGESWKGDDEQGPPPDEFEERIKQLMRAEPFHSFEIVLSSGDRYPVTSGFSLAIGSSSMSTLYPPKGGTFSFRKEQIVGVEVPEPAA